jgi:hypothetical protein
MILNYYSSEGALTTFDNYTIDEHGVVTNINKNTEVTRHDKQRYNRVEVFSNDGTQATLRVARAIASTFWESRQPMSTQQTILTETDSMIH